VATGKLVKQTTPCSIAGSILANRRWWVSFVAEEALYDSPVLRRFAGVDLGPCTGAGRDDDLLAITKT
jgi:hypothetical protein